MVLVLATDRRRLLLAMDRVLGVGVVDGHAPGHLGGHPRAKHLALIFICFWVTMMLGWMTELYSRPVIADKTNYKIPFGRLASSNNPTTFATPMLYIYSRAELRANSPFGMPRTPVGDTYLDFIHAQRKSNYVRRCPAHFESFVYRRMTVMVYLRIRKMAPSWRQS